MITKLLVAGAVGAGLLYMVTYLVNPTPACSTCTGTVTTQTLTTLGSGFAVGAGVQLSVMLLGVS